MQARLHSVFYICLMTYNMTQMTEQKVAQSMQPLSQLARLAFLHPVNDLQLPVVIAAPLSWNSCSLGGQLQFVNENEKEVKQKCELTKVAAKWWA